MNLEPSLAAAPLRWAIAAPGGIAADFTAALLARTKQRVSVVASRSLERAATFAERFDIARHGGYSQIERADVDVVYVASVNTGHAELALRAIAAGKHVLVEKPFAMNGIEARRVADAARRAGVLVMEAMWPRYVPTYRELHRRLTSGDLGDVRLATSSVGWSVPDDPAHRLNRADLGGGVTLDMGVYALWFAQFAVGRVERVLATGTMRGGVDETIVVAIDAPSGRRASVTSTMSATTSGHGEIVGTSGRAVVTGNIVFPSGFDLVLGEKAEEWRDPMPLPFRDGLAWQAAALAGYVAAGVTDSPLHSLDDSIALADTMDAVLTQVRSSRIGVDER